MTVPKRKFREITLQMLFAETLTDAEEEHIVAFFMKQMKITKKVVKEMINYKNKIVDKLGIIDPIIKQLSTEYSLERITLVELNVIRLGFFEIFFCPDLPKTIVIAEAIRLTKKFSSVHSAHYVNAILDSKQAGDLFSCEAISS